jgi:hypothetical protein
LDLLAWEAREAGATQDSIGTNRQASGSNGKYCPFRR